MRAVFFFGGLGGLTEIIGLYKLIVTRKAKLGKIRNLQRLFIHVPLKSGPRFRFTLHTSLYGMNVTLKPNLSSSYFYEFWQWQVKDIKVEHAHKQKLWQCCIQKLQIADTKRMNIEKMPNMLGLPEQLRRRGLIQMEQEQKKVDFVASLKSKGLDKAKEVLQNK